MAAKKTYKIGTRGSRLALAQSQIVLAKLSRKFPEASFSLEIIKTKGDKLINSPLAAIGGKGLFVKEIEEALLRREIDLAVHSLKDLPTEIPEGLTIGAVMKREEARDVLIRVKGQGSRTKKIGTSSLRRKAQLLAWRKDWEVVDLRGNLDTRIRKLSAGEVDVIVVAAAGIHRMKLDIGNLPAGLRRAQSSRRHGWSLVIAKIPFSRMLPAPGQGALAIECRRDDADVQRMVGKLNYRPTELATKAERALLEALGGGCQVPIGAYAKIYRGKMKLEGVVADTRGRVVIRDQGTGNSEQPEELGKKLARKLIKLGARKILNEKR